MRLCAPMFIFLLVFLSCSDSIANGEGKKMAADNPKASDPILQKALIKMAYEKSAEYGLVTNECITKVLLDGDLWTVEFYPSNINQLGGGGKVWFEIKGETIIFKNIELWE